MINTLTHYLVLSRLIQWYLFAVYFLKSFFKIRIFHFRVNRYRLCVYIFRVNLVASVFSYIVAYFYALKLFCVSSTVVAV